MVRHAFQTKTFSFRKRRFAWPPIKGKRVHKRTVKSNPPNATQLWDEYKTLWRFRTCRNYTEQNSSPRLPSHSSNYSFFFFRCRPRRCLAAVSHKTASKFACASTFEMQRILAASFVLFKGELCGQNFNERASRTRVYRGVRVSATGNSTMVTRKPQLMCSCVDNASAVMYGPCIPIAPVPVPTPISSRLKEDYSIFLVYGFIHSLRCGVSVVGKMVVIRKR